MKFVKILPVLCFLPLSIIRSQEVKYAPRTKEKSNDNIKRMTKINSKTSVQESAPPVVKHIVWRKISERTRGNILSELLRRQYVTDQIAVVGDLPDIKDLAYIHYSSDTINGHRQLKRIRSSIVQANRNPLYIIDDKYLNDYEIKLLIRNIREVDPRSFVILFTYHTIQNLGYNILYITGSLNPRFDVDIYQVCAYCHKGKDSFSKMNSWSENLRFERKFIMKSSFQGSFKGAVLKATCAVTNKFKITKGQKEIACNGFDYLILRHLGKTMQYRPVNEKTEGVGRMGGISQIVQDIADKKSDIGFSMTIDTTTSYKYVDFSATFLKNNFVIVTDLPPKGLNSLDIIFSPFTMTVWVTFITTTLLCSLLLYGLEKVSKKKGCFSFGKYLWELVKVTCWDTSQVMAYSPASNSLFLSYLVSVFIIITIYMGVLTSLITTEKYMWVPIDSLEEFEMSNLKWLGVEGSDATAILIANPEMSNRYKYLDRSSGLFGKTGAFAKGFQMLLEHPRTYAFMWNEIGVTRWLELYFKDLNGFHEFHIAKEPYYNSNVVFLLNKEAIYLAEFDKKLLRLVETGIVDHLLDTNMDMIGRIGRGLARAENRINLPKSSEMIELRHLLSAFVFCGALHCLGLICLLVERNFPKFALLWPRITKLVKRNRL